MSKLSVLAVENEPTIRSLLRDFLKTKGHQCVAAACGLEALKMIPKFNPNVVVTGYSLSDMTGLDLDSKIRRTYPATIVIILSEIEDRSNYTNIVKDNAFSFSQMFQQFVGIADSLTEIDIKNGGNDMNLQRNNMADSKLAAYESLLDILLKLQWQLLALKNESPN